MLEVCFLNTKCQDLSRVLLQVYKRTVPTSFLAGCSCVAVSEAWWRSSSLQIICNSLVCYSELVRYINEAASSIYSPPHFPSDCYIIYGTGLPKLGQGIWQQLLQMHRHLLQQHGGQLPNMCKLFIQDVTELGCISLQEPEFEFNIWNVCRKSFLLCYAWKLWARNIISAYAHGGSNSAAGEPPSKTAWEYRDVLLNTCCRACNGHTWLPCAPKYVLKEVEKDPQSKP